MDSPARAAMLAVALALVTTGAPARAPSPPQTQTPAAREQLVRRFVAAYNAQDSAAMGRLVSDDVQWLSIDGHDITIETGSRQALLASMDAYFRSCPSCRSRLSAVAATADRLSTVEIARWRSADGWRQQRSIAVYEFAGPLIRRVYYFPAER